MLLDVHRFHPVVESLLSLLYLPHYSAEGLEATRTHTRSNASRVHALPLELVLTDVHVDFPVESRHHGETFVAQRKARQLAVAFILHTYKATISYEIYNSN